MPISRRPRDAGLHQAFDSVRFGPERTLNLRASLPTADAAVSRAESWLRERQALGAGEVLVITGRGNSSPDGVSVVREAVVKLLASLRRRGVVAGTQEHTAGSFVVRLAPMRALFEAPRRRRDRSTVSARRPPADPAGLRALDAGTRALLRRLAVQALQGLGVRTIKEAYVADEMERQFSLLAAAIPDGPNREARLRVAVTRALDEFDT